jgi:ornithine cyclodeaminase/alanine dehydrogenase
MTGDWLAPDALVVPVDYATMCAASVAHEAALFLVDERAQFLANRDAGQFDGYPDPAATLGEAILAGTPRPPSGRVVVTHLGVGLADVVFADAIVRRAEAAGIGTLLGR